MTDDSKSNATGINFWLENIMNISEATRQNKLAKILDSYAHNNNQAIYIIQNSKKKESACVLSSVGSYLSREADLKALENEVLRLSEEVLRLKSQVRNEQPVYSFVQAVERLGLNQEDLTDIFENSDDVEID